MTLIIICFGIIDFDYFTHPVKLPFREYSSYVKSVKKDGDFLINWYSNGTHHIWETKFYGIPAPIYIPNQGDSLPFFVGTALMEKGDIIRDVPKEAKRVGVITSGPVDEVKLQSYTESEVKTWGQLKFILFTKK
jgi:hypothetical protein